MTLCGSEIVRVLDVRLRVRRGIRTVRRRASGGNVQSGV